LSGARHNCKDWLAQDVEDLFDVAGEDVSFDDGSSSYEDIPPDEHASSDEAVISEGISDSRVKE